MNFGEGGETDVRTAGTERHGSSYITKFRFYPEQVAEYPQVDCEPLPVVHIAPDFQTCHEGDRRAQKGKPCSETYSEGDPRYEECLEFDSLVPASDDTNSFCSVSYDAFSCR